MRCSEYVGIDLPVFICVCICITSLSLRIFVIYTLLMSFLALLTEDTPLLPVEPVQVCPQRNLQGQPENLGEGDKIGENVVKRERGIPGDCREKWGKCLQVACNAFLCLYWLYSKFLIRGCSADFCGYICANFHCGPLFNEGVKVLMHVLLNSTLNNNTAKLTRTVEGQNPVQ